MSRGEPTCWEIAGPAKLIAARTASLAAEGQILMTQMAYELARRAMVGDENEDELEWANPRRVPHPRRGRSAGDLRGRAKGWNCLRDAPRHSDGPAHRAGAKDDQHSRQLRYLTKPIQRAYGAVLIVAAIAVLGLGLWWMAPRDPPPDDGIRRPTDGGPGL